MSDRKASLAICKEIVEVFFYDTVKGETNPYTSVNGNMYSFLDAPGQICLRMAESDRALYADQFGTEPFVQYG